MARRRAQSPPEGKPSTARSRAQPSASTFDTDVEKTESQQILAVPPLLRNPKNEDREMRQFRARVVKDQTALRMLVQGRMGRAREADIQRRKDMTAALLSALQTPNRRVAGPVATFPGTCIAENVSYASAAIVLSASDALVREYERVDEGIVRMAKEAEGEDAVANGWRKEVKDFERVLRAGARKAERDAGKVLGGVRVEEDGADGDVEMDGLQVMQGRETSNELNNSIAYMERGVRRMAKALPREEE